jgi:hypothetical protein
MKGTTQVCYNIKIHTKKGVLYCICMMCGANADEVSAGAVAATKKYNSNQDCP